MLVQILSCNNKLGTCCSDPGMAGIINIIKVIVEMIQIIAPMVLIVAATIQLFKMMMNPDDPRGAEKKSLYNKFIAAVIIFMLPLFVNLILTITANGVKGADQLEIIACFKKSNNKVDYSKGKYYKRDDSKDPVVIVREKKYDKGYTGPPKSTSSSKDSSSTGTSRAPVNENAKDVVAYAKQFLGYPYVWGGNDPHTGSDCSGFVVYIYNKFSKSGHKISRASLPNFGGGSGSANFIKVSPSNAGAGDLVVYSGHYAMLTGNGKQIIHASNKKDGVKLSPSYAYRSIIGIYRYKYLK